MWCYQWWWKQSNRQDLRLPPISAQSTHSQCILYQPGDKSTWLDINLFTLRHCPHVMGFRAHGYKRHDEEYSQQLEAFMHSLDSGGFWFRHCCSDEYSARSLHANKWSTAFGCEQDNQGTIIMQLKRTLKTENQHLEQIPDWQHMVQTRHCSIEMWDQISLSWISPIGTTDSQYPQLLCINMVSLLEQA